MSINKVKFQTCTQLLTRHTHKKGSHTEPLEKMEQLIEGCYLTAHYEMKNKISHSERANVAYSVSGEGARTQP